MLDLVPVCKETKESKQRPMEASIIVMMREIQVLRWCPCPLIGSWR